MRPQYSRHRVDTSQASIIEALELAGYEVYRDLPCDLIVRKRATGKLSFLECKTATGKRNPAARWRKDQEEQNEFCRRTGTLRVTSAEEALKALGEIR